MSQAEAVKVMRLIEEVREHREQIAELRRMLCDLQNAVNAFGKTAMTSGKAKVA